MRIQRLAPMAAMGFLGAAGMASAECPAGIVESVQRAHAGCQVRGCSKEVERDVANYEVRVTTRDGHDLEVVVSAQGSILLDEEGIPVAEVPPIVMAAAVARFGAQPRRAERIHRADGSTSYELALPGHEALFAEDGAYLGEEGEDGDGAEEGDDED